MKKKALIISFKDLEKSTSVFKDKKTVLVGGCFDLIHFGHLKFLEKAKEQGDFLIIALESDEFIKKHKKKLSIHSQKERAEILGNLSMIDMIILLPFFANGRDYFDLVKLISPQVVAVTSGDPQIKNKKKQVEEIGGRLVTVIPLIKKFSTRKGQTVFMKDILEETKNLAKKEIK